MAAGTTARPVGDLVDRALEASVVGSFSRIGFVSRRALGLIGPLDERLDGRACWVTGGSSGLGLTTAIGLARLGAQVRLVVRDEQRGASAAARIREQTGAPDVRVEVCDLSSLASVRGLASRILERDDPVHVLVHNAGVLVHQRQETRDGIELTFATNVLGPYLLTTLLLDRLRGSAPARVLFVTSGGMYTQRLAVDDLQSREGPFDGPAVYSRSKRAEMALCLEWADLLRGSGVVVHAMHPGWADSPGIRDGAAGLLARARPAPAYARGRGRTRSSGSRPPAEPRRRAGSSGSTGDRGRSTAWRARATARSSATTCSQTCAELAGIEPGSCLARVPTANLTVRATEEDTWRGSRSTG